VIAGDKGVRLFFEVERDLPRLVLGDQGRLRQVLVNLVGNAVKFTSRGRVSVLVASSQSMPGNAPCHRRIPPEGRIRLLFSVSDTGSGIPADDLDSIFDSFAQAAPRPAGSPGPSGRQEGTGLGLAIARQLVEMMGGQIKVESQEGKGSIFSFSIELGIAEPAEAGAPAEDPADVPTDPAGRSCSLADRGPLTILLVEDDAVNRLLASELLARRGHRVDAAGTGREALEALAARRYDLVLMDVRMPEMSGEEATRLIRSGRAPGVDRSVPIVALTAHALKGDRERFLAAGMDDYLSKPIDLDRLDRVLDRLSASTRPAGG
jgi:CheY-like chemotaxis protein